MARINDYLNNLSEQTVQEEKDIERVKNPVIDLLVEKFFSLSDQNPHHSLSSSFEKEASTLVKTLYYTARDIAEFSIVLKKYEDLNNFEVKAGIFLSALINNCNEEKFKIITKLLTKKIDFLGCSNEKKVFIDGDVGIYLGNHNKGLIIVKGNAGKYLGGWSSGGDILVKGNAGEYVGAGMLSGRIFVSGRIKSFGAVQTGKIYEKGKLIINYSGGYPV